jgi:hypothetical protein
MNQLYLKIALGVLLIGGAFGFGFLEAKAHYDSKYQALIAETKQIALDQQKKVDAEIIQQNYVTKEIYNEAQTQLAAATTHVDSLLNNGPAVITKFVPTTCLGTSQPSAVTNGPAASGSPGPAQAPAPAASVIDTAALSEALDVGIDAVTAELLWREWYERQNTTGVTK